MNDIPASRGPAVVLHRYRWAIAETLLIAAVIFALLLSRLESYLLFHSIAEIFSIVVAFGVFIVAWNSDSLVKNGYLLLLGVGSLFVAVIDSLHTVAFQGMGVFPGHGANLATQLWLAGRYLHAATWLIAPFLLRRRLDRYATALVYTLATALLAASIFGWHIFPTAYIDGQGLTPFKIISEYVIIGILLAALGFLWQRRSQFDRAVLSWLAGAILAAVASEFAFTQYAGVTDASNMLGHIFKIVEFYLLYRAVVETGFRRPYSLILRQMKQDGEAQVAQQKDLAETRAGQLDAIFNSMTDGAMLYAADGTILRKNGAADQLFSYTRVSADLPMERRTRLHSFVDEDGHPIVRIEELPFLRALNKGELVRDVVLGAPNAITGEIRWLAFSAVPILDAAGQRNGAVCTFHDITERKLAVAEVHRLNEELERRVLDRTGQLEAANQELESFAYSVSHDLRAPLRHIEGFVDLLNKRTKETLDPQSRHYMDLIVKSAAHMGNLIDDLLQYSRLGRNAMLEMELDLGDLARDVIRGLKRETNGRNVDWRVQSLPCVSGDRSMLRIALTNLLSNALKFTLSRECAIIEIGTLELSPLENVVFVRDNGIGFDMQYADKLFGVFQRLHPADEFEGTGIGLANVRRIIARHGGRTWAEATVDGGATFYFSLPRTA